MTVTVGEALAGLLRAHGIEVVFGIPGVHTAELYRGLPGSGLRHVTPRHEQSAGFMADGYARVSGRPGVAFVITGPGVTNILTAMAQARADSVPMLVVSGASARADLGRERGGLHDLPDQGRLMSAVALWSHTLLVPESLPAVVAEAFARLATGRPGPMHLAIPTDVMAARIPRPVPQVQPAPASPRPDVTALAARLSVARQPVLLAGGGVRHCDAAVTALAERLAAPVVLTVNARGLLAGHPLAVPASPSLACIRDGLAAADLVLAIGTEFGPTDFDMYGDGGFPALPALARIDIDPAQLARGPAAALTLVAEAGAALAALGAADLPGPTVQRQAEGRDRATALRAAAHKAIGGRMRAGVGVIADIVTALPGVIIVGDSTQPVYAGNLYGAVDRPGGWFNAATGYGALGYAPGAAIGAALADPAAPVVCLIGDGGFQFALAEIGAARDEGVSVIFLVWNNAGYREIEDYMTSVGVAPEGVRPSAPDFCRIAEAYGIPATRLPTRAALIPALRAARAQGSPALIDLPEALVTDLPPA